MKSITRYVLVLLLSTQIGICKAQDLFTIKSGKVSFVSNAPLEVIKAENESFQFLIDTSKNEFAVSVPIKEFYGFNSSLQREHFFENYMQTDAFPKATFTGKILDEIAYREGAFDVMVRGQLTIHGVKKERIIEARCFYESKEKLIVNATFVVPLEDHDIEIPRIVFQKIAEMITVNIHAELIPKN